MSLTRFMELFQGRPDVFAEQQDDGSYRPIRRPITEVDYIAHGKGQHTYGIYSVREDSATKFIAWDIDTFLPGPLAAIEDALDYLEISKRSYLIELSGRKGHHVWLPFDHWVPASHAYRAGRAVMQKAGVDVECYPKQKYVTDLGNLIKLPLGVHRVTGQNSKFIGWAEYLGWRKVEPIDTLQLVRLADLYQEPESPVLENREPLVLERGDPRHILEAKLDNISQTPEGQRNETLYKTAVWLFNWVHSGAFSRDAVVLGLTEAGIRAGLLPGEVGRTVNSAWEFSLKKPLPLTVDPTKLPKRLEVGNEITFKVEGEIQRPDGRVAYILGHPDVQNKPIAVL